MKSVWLQRANRPRALVFFAGWGMDERPFRRLTSDDYDVCVCFDYRNLVADLDSLPMPRVGAPVADSLADWMTYAEITVVGWSFGCAVAAQVMSRLQWSPRDALAINGTVQPQDDEVGIPARWLDATADRLHRGGWLKFVRRMCRDSEACQDFAEHAPERDLVSVVNELTVLRQVVAPNACGFRRALIGTKDRIILPENQRRCWERHGVPIRMIRAPHYPFHLWQTWEELLAI